MKDKACAVNFPQETHAFAHMTCDFCCKCHACICRQGVVELKRPLNIGLRCFDFVWTDCWEDMHLNSTHQITITAINVDTPVVAGAAAAAVKSFCFINPLKGLECTETHSPQTHTHTRVHTISGSAERFSVASKIRFGVLTSQNAMLPLSLQTIKNHHVNPPLINWKIAKCLHPLHCSH